MCSLRLSYRGDGCGISSGGGGGGGESGGGGGGGIEDGSDDSGCCCGGGGGDETCCLLQSFDLDHTRSWNLEPRTRYKNNAIETITTYKNKYIEQAAQDHKQLAFKKELDLLGVVVKFKYSYQLVLDNLKFSSSLASLSSETLLLILNCIQYLRSSDKLVQAIKNNKCSKTNLGYRCPSECFLSNHESEWGCLLKLFGSFSVLDEQYYGRSICLMANKLKKTGVMVHIEDSSKEFTRVFKKRASVCYINKETGFCMLHQYDTR
ncbi:hypothetical protein L2E82_19731 [Cichorium intybus]|uniref:Uncharacterized protein n=1 Tax=Cichorium intybus TaxID=13427 RepID=A0ACB9FC41_CICIN|nr:hypothetical protein L2E82_19731 [Cichorium intybus]